MMDNKELLSLRNYFDKVHQAFMYDIETSPMQTCKMIIIKFINGETINRIYNESMFEKYESDLKAFKKALKKGKAFRKKQKEKNNILQ